MQIGQSAKSLFDAADAADWGAAADDLQTLNEGASSLPTALLKPALVGQLRSGLEGLRDNVSARRRVETMDDANLVTRLVAELSAKFQPRVPYEAVMLGYYGRQLTIGITAARPALLTQATTDLRATWNALQPAIEAHGRTDESRRFTDIVVDLEVARRPAEFVAPTHAALAEAARIETLFRWPTHGRPIA